MNIMGNALAAAARGRLEQLLTKHRRENISRRQDLSFAPLLKNFVQKKNAQNKFYCAQDLAELYPHAAASTFISLFSRI